MSMALGFEDDLGPNPLDMVEQLVAGNDWAFDRRSDEELAVEVPGRWCNYSLYFAWRADMAALHFTCAFDMKVPAAKRAQVCELLVAMNEKLWLGHFGLWEEEGLPMFRHTALCPSPAAFSPEQMEDVVDLAVAECERFYPAFQFVIWGGKSPKEAMAASLLETVGEA